VRALPDRLLLVTDRHLCVRALPSVVQDAVSAGVRWVWFRDKDLAGPERLALARAVQEAVAGRAALSIGSDVEIAVALGLSAVHLPMSADLVSARARLRPGALIGLSAHALADVARAKAMGADYVTLSPIFATASKPGYGPALGLASLAAARAIGLPVVALGGMMPETAGSAMAAGASAIAVMGGIFGTDDVAGNVRAYKAMLDGDNACA
jgi:thiamine-phosphate pyrophosphorylase